MEGCIYFPNDHGAVCNRLRNGRRGSQTNAGQNGGENVGTDNGEKVTLKFTFWGSPEEKKAVESAIKAFEEKNPNITIDPVHIPGTDFLQKLNAMIAGNEAPDISYSAAWKLNMGEEGLIYNFFDLMKDDPSIKKEDYLEYAWWNWEQDKSAGPYQASVVPSLMYNADMFQEGEWRCRLRRRRKRGPGSNSWTRPRS